ncbi:MAG: TolC family protein [Abditibacteriota bacterium]|nr:TolC family protein [Abditibacteriota bacterium]
MKKICLSCFLFLLCLASCLAQENAPAGPFSLDECIAMACVVNPDLAIARNNLESSGTNVTRALSQYFPQLSLSNDTFEIAEKKHRTMDKGTTLSASLKLFDMGLRELNLSAARSSREQQQQNYYRTLQTVVFNVSRAYYNLLKNRELLEVSRSAVEYYEQLEKETEAQIEQGVAAPVDILSIQSQLANSRVSLLTGQSNAKEALNDLQNTIGLPITEGFDVKGGAPEDDRELESLEEYIRLALDHRSDLTAQDHAVNAAETDKKIAQREYLPKLDVTGSYNRYFDRDRLYTSDARIMGTISLNIFDGFSREATVKARKLSLDNARITREDLVNDITHAVTSLYSDILIARDQIEASKAGLEAARKNREVQTEKYSADMATNLDILNAQMQLDTALSNSINSKYNYKIDLIEMDYQTGTIGIIGAEQNEKEE